MEKEIAQYFANKDEVAAVYLFGSHAGNRARPFSDVDIAVLFKRNDEELAARKRNEYLIELGLLTKMDIHPIIMNTAGEELLRQIFSTGKCIQVNKKDILTQFRTHAFVKIADFYYYRTQMKRGILRKLKEATQIG